MTFHYTLQFLSLVEEIAEDGELSNKEIYQLAKWMNENKEGRKCWPANLFLPLLKDVFADGKIDSTEAIQVAQLIQKVRREWVRKNTPVKAIPIDNPVDSAIKRFDDRLPSLPSIATTLTVASFAEPDADYKVDLNGPTCTCPDFKSYRQGLPVGHLSRCCKHIMKGYSEIRPETGWPSWLESFLESGFRPFPDQVWAVYHVNNCNYLVSSANPEWGNVYALVDGESRKYGYSIFDERWSYGREPDSAVTLARAVSTISER